MVTTEGRVKGKIAERGGKKEETVVPKQRDERWVGEGGELERERERGERQTDRHTETERDT